MYKRQVVESVINLTVSVVLVLKLGIYGVLIGTIIAYIYRTNDIIIYANKKILCRSCWNTYKKVIINMSCFSMIVLASQTIDLSAKSFLDFFIMGIPCGLLICIGYLLVMIIFEKDASHFMKKLFRKQKME